MSLFLEFITTLKSWGLEKYDRYYSVYPGIVKDNKDPEKRGRIKVELPTILGSGKVHGTWVDLHASNLAGKEHGEFFPPYIGDMVDVMFEHGDLNYPIYRGGTYAVGELHKDILASYGNVRGWVFKNGTRILVDETPGKEQIRLINFDKSSIILDGTKGKEAIYLFHSKGSNVQLAKDGSVKMFASDGTYLALDATKGIATMQSKKGALISLNDKITMSDKSGKQIISVSDSAVEITANSDVILTAKSVTLNSGGVTLGAKGSLGICLAKPLQEFLDGKYILTTVVGPTGPPVIPVAINNLNPVTSFESLFIKAKPNL